MRNLILIGLFAIFVARAGAAERITVEELGRRLAANSARATNSAHGGLMQDLGADTDLLHEADQDTELARQIGTLELSQRLTAVTMSLFFEKYQPGLETERALQLLSDRSAFLDPPASELPAMAAPDEDSQKQMVAAARVYVLQTLQRLPNFFATRTTARLANEQVMGQPDSQPALGGLREVGSSSLEITFRDGQEYVGASSTQNSNFSGAQQQTLDSSGEFGPEPGIVLSDTAKGNLTFRYWEQTPAGLAAVFLFAVPKAESHYEVNYNCTTNKSVHEVPGYHGSLAIDPTSGAILRITLEADWSAADPISHVASVIEYAPVTIGDRRYVCPLRSLAFSTEEANACTHKGQKLTQPLTMLNRTTFTHYHRLGSALRIVPDASGTQPVAPKSN